MWSWSGNHSCPWLCSLSQSSCCFHPYLQSGVSKNKSTCRLYGKCLCDLLLGLPKAHASATNEFTTGFIYFLPLVILMFTISSMMRILVSVSNDIRMSFLCVSPRSTSLVATIFRLPAFAKLSCSIVISDSVKGHRVMRCSHCPLALSRSRQ